MKKIFLIAFFTLITGCVSTADHNSTIPDPLEKINRSTHEFNKSIDSSIILPVSDAYGSITPESIRNILSNFSSNLSEPLRFINHTLQGNLLEAGKTSIRFGLNTTFGIAGIFDVASYLEIYHEDTNFDTTLKTWNLSTGPYLELPFLGPSSLRGSIGTLIDFSLDPIGSNINSAYNVAYYSTRGFDVLNLRYEFKDTIQSVLYESFDSYESGKNYYLQRVEGVSSENSEDELFELYLSE
ncbi:MAG: VacJ family lipoprotein [Paracoccaceae bacterium]